jgi:opacity protein-like surface antigen
LIFSALLEYYLTPRVSLRTDFGLTDPGFGAESTDSLRQIPLRVDLNDNWERGRWHPFVGAGAGAYFLRFKDNGQGIGASETKLGVNLGGGIEYFTGRTVAIKGEARYHMIDDTRSGLDPSGLVLTAGLKKYW